MTERKSPARRGALTRALVAALLWFGAAGAGAAQTTERVAGRVDSLAESAHLRLPGDRTDLWVVIETADRLLLVLQGPDTVLHAPIGVGTGRFLAYGSTTWRFRTPLGERRVVRKLSDPIWVPPDWHYAETARNHGLTLVRLPSRGVTLRNGARLEIRDNVVGLIAPGGEFEELPVDEHIVFDGRLFIPPIGTRNRRVERNLGAFALDLGDGYLIHGTTNPASIGAASTHGCIRVGDDDLAWLFENVPVGTRVVVR